MKSLPALHAAIQRYDAMRQARDALHLALALGELNLSIGACTEALDRLNQELGDDA